MLRNTRMDIEIQDFCAERWSGGVRKRKHFFEKKLKVDVAIIVIEMVLDFVYRCYLPGGIPAVKRQRRLYYGVGLLHYLRIESSPEYPSGSALPDHLDQEHSICRRYHARRAEAMKYLSLDARECLGESIRRGSLLRRIDGSTTRLIAGRQIGEGK